MEKGIVQGKELGVVEGVLQDRIEVARNLMASGFRAEQVASIAHVPLTPLPVRSEPEQLKRALGCVGFETIGEALAKDCYENTTQTWGHELLEHNESELHRMMAAVKPFLFS